MKFTKNISQTSLNYEKLPERTVLHNARVIDPVNNINEETDILLENGIIVKTGKNLNTDGATVFDLTGKILAPGFMDMHVHLREPGREDEETIESGCLAAANGGFTAVASMPNTDPPVDSQEMIQYIKDRAKELLVDVFPIAAITKNREGKELAGILELVEAGAVAISDDGSPVMNSEIMRRALQYSQMVHIPIIVHEEDVNMTEDANMHEGFVSTKLGLKGWPSVAESTMVQRDIELTRYMGGALHIAHISTKEAIHMVREAKKQGLKVTAEATPHHFSLTDRAVESFDTNTKMNPPLREDEDKLAVIEGLKDGTIDAIVTDHAPHSIEEKEMEYIYAPYGIIGLETAIGLTMERLVNENGLPVEKMIELFAVNPRKILNIPVPSVKVGERANFTILDPTAEWTVNIKKFLSKSINSPFGGMKLTGKPYMVINNNKYFESIL